MSTETLTRYSNWPQLFHEFIDSRKSLPFDWGSNDCALFVADSVNAMTGHDLGACLRGQYSSLAGAVVKMAEITGRPRATVEDIAEHLAPGPERKSALFAQRGDIVLFDSEEGAALGMVWLNGIDCLFVAHSGLNKIGLTQCRRAWRV